LKRPEPSPSKRAAVIGTFTSNLVGSIIATPLPELILKSSRPSIDSGGILNNPLPSPWNSDADILPLMFTEPVNSEPLCGDCTTNPKFGDTDAVTEPDTILGAAAACTFCSCEPSPIKNCAYIDSYT
jgi:hypothetical protein